MSSRDDQIRQFLKLNGAGDAEPDRLPSDASKRSYLRLRFKDGSSKILMDAPPNEELKTIEFIRISEQLEKAGLNVPKIYSSDLKIGLLLLEDLGSDTAAEFLSHSPKSELGVYQSALRAIFVVENVKVSALSTLDEKVAGDMVEISATHYAQRPDLAFPVNALMRDYFRRYCAPEFKLALRDFHLENVIWNEDAHDDKKVGLLDYQDAFMAPQGYDLISLLRDVRRDVSEETRTKITQMYHNHYGLGPDFDLQLRYLAVQRNLRILGVFARLIFEQKKHKYLSFLGRTWSLLMDDLDREEFSELRTLIASNFPEPNEGLMQRWSNRA